MFRRGVTSHTLTQQVQLALPFVHQSLAACEFLETSMHSRAKAVHLPAKAVTMKVGAKRLELIAPAAGVLSNDRAFRRTLSEALTFMEVDLLSETGAGVAAGVSHQ